MAKKTIYTNARYPEKINDLVNNYGEINEKALEINPVIEAKADLVDGKVPQSELPSYVDDVIEGYYVKAQGKFYKDAEHTIEIQGEESKIYVDLTANLSYRWSGSTFVQVNEVDLDDYYTKSAVNALLDDKVDAVEGKGLSSNDFTDAEKQKLGRLDNYDDTEIKASLEDKVDKVENKGLSSNDYTDADKLKVSGMAKVATSGSYTDLSNKPTIPTSTSQLTNTNFVRYDTSYQGLTTTQKSNARTNIGAGTSNFSGNYNDLSGKPNIPDAVVANPTLVGTEEALESLQIGTTKYKIEGGGSGDAYTKAETDALLSVSEERIEELIQGGGGGGDWTSDWNITSTEVTYSDLPQELKAMLDDNTAYSKQFKYLGELEIKSVKYPAYILFHNNASTTVCKLVLITAQSPITFATYDLGSAGGSSVSNYWDKVFIINNTLGFFNSNDYRFYTAYISDLSSSIYWNECVQISSAEQTWLSIIQGVYVKGSDVIILTQSRLLYYPNPLNSSMPSISSYKSFEIASVAGMQPSWYNPVTDSVIFGEYGAGEPTFHDSFYESISTHLITPIDTPLTSYFSGTFGWGDKLYYFNQDWSNSTLATATIKMTYPGPSGYVDEYTASFTIPLLNINNSYTFDMLYYDQSNNKIKAMTIAQEGQCPWTLEQNSLTLSGATWAQVPSMRQIKYIGDYNNESYYVGVSYETMTAIAHLFKKQSTNLVYIARLICYDSSSSRMYNVVGTYTYIPRMKISKAGDLFYFYSYNDGSMYSNEPLSIYKASMASVLDSISGGEINLYVVNNKTLIYSMSSTNPSSSSYIDVSGIDFIYENNEVIQLFLYTVGCETGTWMPSNLDIIKIILGNSSTATYYNLGRGIKTEDGNIIQISGTTYFQYLANNKFYCQVYDPGVSGYKQWILTCGDYYQEPYGALLEGIQLNLFNEDVVSNYSIPTRFNDTVTNYLCGFKYKGNVQKLDYITDEGIVSSQYLTGIFNSLFETGNCFYDNHSISWNRTSSSVVVITENILRYTGSNPSASGSDSSSEITPLEQTLLNLYNVIAGSIVNGDEEGF